MDGTTLWLIAGGILLVATVVVGFVAVGRRRALRTGEQPPSLESPPRGWEKPAEDAGDAPSATQVDVRATPQEVEIPDIELAPEAPELEDGGTLKVTQTATPVQLDEVLTALQSDSRQDLKDLPALPCAWPAGTCRHP